MTKITVEDKATLKSVLQLSKETINDKIVMVSDNLIKLCTWVDALYRVHPNMKIHTGGSMSFAYGILHFKSIKQKLDTKISTEDE